jgi:serine phosphatase RsbU (regulator of sigma subunit)
VILDQRVSHRTRELAKANADIEQTLADLRQKDERLAANIEQARQFQEKILPKIPAHDAVQFATVYQPLEVVSGDIFDICEVAPAHFRIFLADATGHGVQAAMRTTLLKLEYDRLKREHHDPAKVLQALNHRLVELFPEGEMMCTGLCLDVLRDGDGATASLANAASPPPVLLHGTEATEVQSDGTFLGMNHDHWPMPTIFRVDDGDVLFVFSDGLCEQQNAEHRSFDHLRALGDLTGLVSAETAIEALCESFGKFRASTPVGDDLTVLAIRLTRGPLERSDRASRSAATGGQIAAPMHQ